MAAVAPNYADVQDFDIHLALDRDQLRRGTGNAITRADVQDWINALSAKGLAPNTVRQIYRDVFKAIIALALDDELMARTPCRQIEPRAATKAAAAWRFRQEARQQQRMPHAQAAGRLGALAPDDLSRYRTF